MSLAAGCAQKSPKTPPLKELYRHKVQHDQPPLIVIPGAFGSRLLDVSTNREIWPRSSMKLLFSSYKGLEVDIDESTLNPVTDSVRAYQVFREGLGQDFYGKILATLERIGGYRRRHPGEHIEADQRNYYVYLYDWRLDNVAAVGGLHDLIEQIRHDYGDPNLKVDILAHSNGGLLARYYARYGVKDYLDSDLSTVPITYEGAPAIRRLLMVGTPNLGTIQPVLSHVRGEEVGFRKIPADVVATISGAPQLMPHPDIPWLVDTQGNIIEKDVFDIETWRDLKWSIFDPKVRDKAIQRKGGGAAARRHMDILQVYLEKHLLRGKNFMLLLSRKSSEQDVRPYVFGGDCDSTLARLVVEKQRNKLVAREIPEMISPHSSNIDYHDLMFEPGDSVVVRNSLLGRYHKDSDKTKSAITPMNISHSVFLCEKHQYLTGNPTFQNNLLYTLFSKNIS